MICLMIILEIKKLKFSCFLYISIDNQGEQQELNEQYGKFYNSFFLQIDLHFGNSIVQRQSLISITIQQMGCGGSIQITQQQPISVLIEQNKQVQQVSHSNKPTVNVQRQMQIQKQVKNTSIESSHAKKLAEFIEQKFLVIKRFQKGLSELTYTEGSLMQFIQVFIKCIKRIGNGETSQDKIIVKSIFSPQTILEIKQEKKFFGDLLKQLKDIKKGQISEANKSRIYHEIANVKKEMNEKCQIQKNKYGLSVQKTYEYSQLSDEQTDQVVKLQHVGAEIQKLGEIIKFKLDSARKQTEAISQLLGNTFSKYTDSIARLKYDLSVKEAMYMAQVSRLACDHYENGVFLLVIYFVRSCSNLQKQNQTVAQIQEKMNTAISEISKKYPPGQNLSNEDLQYKGQLQTIELKDKFVTQAQSLKPTQKQQQLESIIKYHARIAKQCKPLFETIVKQTCLEDCLSFKLGLKFNVDNPNPKAITRIIEKMLFKNDKSSKQKQQATIIKSIQQQLNKEDEDYRKKIQQKLQNQQSVIFSISDMVRGKCIFSSIEDIIQTVYKIKKYVADNPSKYRLIEVESRFNKETPISDVTLKIALEQKIVAELQLTLQTNAATYTFAHKIYEFSRSKVFSKIKVVDNYHKEFEWQFNTLVGQRVRLAEAHKANSVMNQSTRNIKICSAQIRKYCNIKEDNKIKSFRQILELQLLRVQNQIGEDQIWADEKLQELILPIFLMKFGEWGLTLGDKISTIILKQNHSDIFKSTLIYFFYSRIDGQQHLQSIKQFQNKRTRQIIKQQRNNSQWKEFVIKLQEYLQVTFKLKGVEQYHNNNARLFYQFKNLSNMIDYNFLQGKVVHNNLYQINRIFGEHSEQTFLFFLSLAKVSFLRKQQTSPFQSLCQWSIDLIQNLYAKESRKQVQYIANIQLLMAQNYLDENKNNQAIKLLGRIVKIFQEKEDYKRQIECDLMLVECKIKQKAEGYLQNYKKAYAKVLQKVLVKGIPFKGRTVADTEWRIAQKLWQIAKQTKNNDIKKETLDTHYRRAMVLLSTQNVQKCVVMSTKIPWSEFKKNNLKNPQLKENRLTSILQFRMQTIGEEGCEVLKAAKIPRLTQLFLGSNGIGGQGCKNLVSANWPNLNQLDLRNNQISSYNCKDLITSKWPNLRILYLGSNMIGIDGCQYLKDGNWPQLSQLNLSTNKIGSAGCQHLVSANWPNLSQLELDWCQIGKQGCKILVTANWPSFSQLRLWDNKIGNEGCQHLKNSNWPNLTYLDLKKNQIGTQGCQYLSQANWPNLNRLDLQYNFLKSESLKQLKNGNWPKLSVLMLWENDLLPKDKQLLKNNVWPSSTVINI